MVYTMRTNSLLTPCKQGAVLSRYSISLFHEHELRTHAANLEQARCGTFTLLCTSVIHAYVRVSEVFKARLIIKNRAQHTHTFFERLTVQGLVFEGRAIVVYGARGVVEKGGYLRTLLDTEAYECEDA